MKGLGKKTLVLRKFIMALEKGQEAILIGLDYVVISPRRYYQLLFSKYRPPQFSKN